MDIARIAFRVQNHPAAFFQRGQIIFGFLQFFFSVLIFRQFFGVFLFPFFQLCFGIIELFDAASILCQTGLIFF